MTHNLEGGTIDQVRDIHASAGIEIVYTVNFVPGIKQSFTQVRTKKIGVSGNHDAFGRVEILHEHPLFVT